MTALNTFVVRDSATIRDGILRVIRSGLISRGVTNPNVLPGSDWYVEAQAIANQLAVIEANAVIKADELMPDTSTGDGLSRICAVFGITKQAAAGSTGSVTITASAAVSINSGDKLVDGQGLSYQATVTGTYNSGDSVPIESVSTGKETNLDAGSVLRWVATPAFCDEKVTVTAGGLVNGADAEDDEALRARLFALLQSPPLSGNAEHVAEWAEASTGSVQKAFVYPAIQGPSTVHAAVTAAPTSTNKSRQVAAATVTGIVSPYVQGQLPEHAYAVVTTVTDVNADVAIALALPEAPTASPPGPGGGWINGTPWPSPDGSSTFRCTVTGVTSTTVFTVDATTSPNVNVSQICWLSPYTWTLHSALVTAVSGTSGAYTITLDKPFPNIATGCYIWPKAQNAQTYVNAVLGAFALMGPGEKTSNVSALVRGFRHPRSSAGWQMTLGTHLTSAVIDAADEVQAATFYHRTDGSTTVTGASSTVTPQISASLSDAPKIFVPRHIAFYRIA